MTAPEPPRKSHSYFLIRDEHIWLLPDGVESEHRQWKLLITVGCLRYAHQILGHWCMEETQPN